MFCLYPWYHARTVSCCAHSMKSGVKTENVNPASEPGVTVFEIPSSLACSSSLQGRKPFVFQQISMGERKMLRKFSDFQCSLYYLFQNQNMMSMSNLKGDSSNLKPSNSRHNSHSSFHGENHYAKAPAVDPKQQKLWELSVKQLQVGSVWFIPSTEQ